MIDFPPVMSKREAREARRQEIRRAAEVMRQRCPKCGADVGEQCHTMPSWWPAQPHAGRLRAAGQ